METRQADKWDLELNDYQSEFILSKARYPGMVASIGTGKTLCLLLKIWTFCERYPDSLALVVRKEFTDLKDSTIADFEKYFNVKVDAHKNYEFSNGSKIMFRHGAELNVLKNINLSIFGIEQAEEFDTKEQFTFLRDRLRRQTSPMRQGIIIANANGHNWIWKLWIDGDNKKYHSIEANTFDNAHNLPDDFLQDLREMEEDAPHHYARYVMNSHEEQDTNDILLPFKLINSCYNLGFVPKGVRVLGVDPAEFGDDLTVFTTIQRCANGWKQVYLKKYAEQDPMVTCGRIIDLLYTEQISKVTIDRVGLGSPMEARLKELSTVPVIGFDSRHNSDRTRRLDFVSKGKKSDFFNKRTEAYFLLKNMMKQGKLELLEDEKQENHLNSIRFAYRSNGQRMIVSKKVMKDKHQADSPDCADALSMVISAVEDIDEIYMPTVNSVTSLRTDRKPVEAGMNSANVSYGFGKRIKRGGSTGR